MSLLCRAEKKPGNTNTGGIGIWTAAAIALLAGGFRMQEVTLVDLFPQTFHIEAVARLASAHVGDR